jgi:hypothetical protein
MFIFWHVPSVGGLALVRLWSRHADPGHNWTVPVLRDRNRFRVCVGRESKILSRNYTKGMRLTRITSDPGMPGKFKPNATVAEINNDFYLI